MKILHTSDWHLGRSLYGKKRYEEFSRFLAWLAKTIEEQTIEALLVAGDVFDTCTPSNSAQELYYRFLCRVATSCCQNIVIIAGNHDSPSFLDAPKEILRVMNVHVVGATTTNPEDELLVLYSAQNQAQAIVCAVPYLRDKDLRTVATGETFAAKNAKLIAGLKQHYLDVCAIATRKQQKFVQQGLPRLPIIAMGHLFTTGGLTVDGDGVRDLYIGNLAHLDKEVFPKTIDYLALGHLHVPQCVGNTQHMRYSGSPIPMGFGEATQDKKIISIEFQGTIPNIREIQVPCFQKLQRIVGSLDFILNTIAKLHLEGSQAWIEIEYTGTEVLDNLRDIFVESLADSKMQIIRIKNKKVSEQVLQSVKHGETLDDLDVYDVFARCLDSFSVPEENRRELLNCYQEIIQSIQEKDINAF